MDLLWCSLSLACPLWPQAADLSHTWTSPCKLDVVLVRFADGTPLTEDTLGHNDHDIPHGGTLRIVPATATSPQTDEWLPGASSYTLDDFKRLFGVSGTSFSGTDLTVANGEGDLPLVFGSVADYYNEVSGGDYRLEVRIVNRAMTGEIGDYPDWIRLPHTRWDYARGMYNFLSHAYTAATAAGYTDLPDGSSIASRKRHKVAFVYGGPEIADNSRLHPRVDQTTTISADSERLDGYGYRYVAAERKGSGNPNDHDSTGSPESTYMSTRSDIFLACPTGMLRSSRSTPWPIPIPPDGEWREVGGGLEPDAVGGSRSWCVAQAQRCDGDHIRHGGSPWFESDGSERCVSEATWMEHGGRGHSGHGRGQDH